MPKRQRHNRKLEPSMIGQKSPDLARAAQARSALGSPAPSATEGPALLQHHYRELGSSLFSVE
jgi:hypothetical protein